MAQLTTASLFSEEEEEERHGLTTGDLFGSDPSLSRLPQVAGDVSLPRLPRAATGQSGVTGASETPNLLAEGAGLLKTLAMDPIPPVQRAGERIAGKIEGMPRSSSTLAPGFRHATDPAITAKAVKFLTSLSPLDYASLPLMGGTALLKEGTKAGAKLLPRALSALDRATGLGVGLSGLENVFQGNLPQGVLELILGRLGIHTGGKLKRAAATEKARAVAVATDPMVLRVREALKEARIVAEEQKVLTTELRARQGESSRKVLGEYTADPSGGHAALQKDLNVARAGGGEQAVLRPLTEHLSQDEIDTVTYCMAQHPWRKSPDFKPGNAVDAITRWVKGEHLRDHEIKLFTEVFGEEGGGAVAKGLEGAAWFKDRINLPKAVMASGDISAFLRQNVFFTFSRPITSLKALAQAAPSLMPTKLGKVLPGKWGEDAYQTLMRNIDEHPAGQAGKESKLAITGLDDVLPREEQFMSNLAEEIPIIGPWVRASGRFHIGFLNKVRLDTFADIGGKFKVQAGRLRKQLDGGQLSGDAAVQARKRIEQLEDSEGLAEYINVMTGRGGLGKLEWAGAYLNAFLFSPRFASSRASTTGLLDVVGLATRTATGGKIGAKWGFYSQLPAPLRKEAMRDVGITVASLSGLLALASRHDDVEVDLNWRSADFGKGRIGKTRIDIEAGHLQFLRLYAGVAEAGVNMLRAPSGERMESLKSPRETLSGKEVQESVGQKLRRFAGYKMAPIPRGIVRGLSGEDPFPEGIAGFAPLAAQDFVQALNEYDLLPGAAGIGAAAAAGWGVQIYDAPAAPETQARFQKGQRNMAEAEERDAWRKLPDTRTVDQKSIDYLGKSEHKLESVKLNEVLRKLILRGENDLARRLVRKARKEGLRPDLEKLTEATRRQEMEALTEGPQ